MEPSLASGIILHLRLTLCLPKWKLILIETGFIVLFWSFCYLHFGYTCLWPSFCPQSMNVFLCFQQGILNIIIKFLGKYWFFFWHSFNPTLPHLVSLNLLTICTIITNKSQKQKLNQHIFWSYVMLNEKGRE